MNNTVIGVLLAAASVSLAADIQGDWIAEVSAKGTDSRRHPAGVSRKASLGRLMHSSMTCGAHNKGCSARSVSDRAEASARRLPSGSGGSQLIH